LIRGDRSRLRISLRKFRVNVALAGRR
jgi:hypothetical protein